MPTHQAFWLALCVSVFESYFHNNGVPHPHCDPYMINNRILRIIAWPLTILYGLAVIIRGWLFDVGILTSRDVLVPTLCIGNLTVGGTGKSPLAREILTALLPTHRIAMLSRGYGRSTRGFRLVTPHCVASETGDEPLMIAKKMKDAMIAVHEDRIAGCKELLHHAPDLELIILDDAFQHRRINPTMSLLLTDYSRLYTRDHFLPVGLLRDTTLQARRATGIVVTKCPPTLSQADAEALIRELHPRPNQTVLFASIEQETPYAFSPSPIYSAWSEVGEIVALAGIARPKRFFSWARKQGNVVKFMALRDHQKITPSISAYLKQCTLANRTILTTEKDAVRLQEAFASEPEVLRHMWVAPIQMRWLFNGEKKLKDLLDGLF